MKGTGYAADAGIVDEIKDISGADATLFYGSTRLLTTIKNLDGSRAGRFLLLVTVVISHFSKKLVYSLDEAEKFWGEIAEGDLTAQIAPYMLKKDPLTGLGNRRSCEVVLKSLKDR